MKQLYVAPQRTAIVMSLTVNWVVGLMITVLRGVVAEAVEIADTSGQGCHWADCLLNRIMMDICPFGSIFGVGNGDGRGTVRLK
jgi:hypothetical protein